MNSQLGVQDIRMINGRWCIDLLHLEDGDPKNRERRIQLNIKTDAGRRVIPICDAVIDDGFLDFVEQRRRLGGDTALLIPQCQPDKHGCRSAALSKRLNRAVDRVVTDPRYVVYSASHSFAAFCDAAGVPPHIRDRLMGHENGEVEAKDRTARRRRAAHVRKRYESPILSPEEMAWIDKLVF